MNADDPKDCMWDTTRLHRCRIIRIRFRLCPEFWIEESFDAACQCTEDGRSGDDEEKRERSLEGP